MSGPDSSDIGASGREGRIEFGSRRASCVISCKSLEKLNTYLQYNLTSCRVNALTPVACNTVIAYDEVLMKTQDMINGKIILYLMSKQW